MLPEANEGIKRMRKYIPQNPSTPEANPIPKDEKNDIVIPKEKPKETPKNTDSDTYDYSNEEDGQW